MKKLVFLVAVVCAASFAQTTSSRITGTITDPAGAAVPAATITVVNTETGQTFSTATGEQGEYAVPSIPAATYRITVTAKGFRTSVAQDVKLDAAVPATVNLKLEVGAVSETIDVTAAAEVIQSSSATVSSTLVGRQLLEVPITTRNLLELTLTLPGTQTPGTPRTSSINGLPKGSMNISLDGLNIQDNLLRSDDGFFTTVMPRTDAIEEVTISTAGVGAESAGEGAAQIRFVTKSGTNAFHGGGFWQNRNSFFNANYYFNTVNRLPRDVLNLNQTGFNVGGPFKKNKAFFFVNFEDFRLPQTYLVAALIPNQEALDGWFRYQDAQTREVRRVNLFSLAAQKNPSLPAGTRAYATTIDSTIQNVLSSYIKLATPSTGSFRDRIGTSNDYNRNDFTFQAKGKNDRRFLTMKGDYNISANHHFDVVWNYQTYVANPDGVNAIYPLLPGTGSVINHPEVGGTRRISYSVVGTLRSTLRPTLTNEARWGTGPAGNSIFREEIAPALFDQFRGYAPQFTGATGYWQNPQRTSSQSRRNTPTMTFADNLTWMKSAHLLNFGGSVTQIKSWQQSLNSAVFPTMTFNIIANDPINTGTTGIFDLTNFPGSSAANRTDAQSMYAILTGRISSIARSVNISEDRKFAHVGTTDRNRMREMALYVQDSWKLRPNFTLNYGARWDVQFPLTNLNGTYTDVGWEGIWGISGVGNLFKPGVLAGKTPVFNELQPGARAYKTNWKQVQPSIGFAWTLPGTQAPVLSWLIGREGRSVLRSGYSIATVREGMDFIINVWGGNQGRSSSLTVGPDTFPEIFGTAGSRWFRDASYPARPEPTAPTYPIPVQAGNAQNTFHPNLKMGYVQSWNLSLQRELSKSTVLDVRYVGNQGVGLWRQVNLNEVNIVENKFLDEFKVAQNNLAIANGMTVAQLQSLPNSLLRSTNFGNQNLPGQAAIPIILTSGVPTNDVTFAGNLQRGQAGTFAAAIGQNATRLQNLIRAGYPANLFTVNPASFTGGAFLVLNGGFSSYNSLQVEARRRLSKGLLVQGSYTWSKSLSNMQASSSAGSSQPTTFRSPENDKGASPWDIRHGFKVNYIYELPFGPGRRWGSSGNVVARKALEGWQVSGLTRLQSGSPDRMTGRNTFNGQESGVVLHNMTIQELNDSVKIRKTTSPTSGFGQVYWLPQDFINNSMAAWEVGGLTRANLDPTKPFLGPQMEAGKLGYRMYLYGPWQSFINASLAKVTKIGESKSLEIRAQALNLLNSSNFLLGAAGNEVNSAGITSTFAQTTSAYRDITVSGSSDPGGRIIEFQLRFKF